MKQVTIIGAGIGGLTAALMFQQNGIEVAVYEAAQELRPVGAGIMIANNAMQVFRSLGIHEKIAKAGLRLSNMVITDENLKAISPIDLTGFEKKYGVHNVAIHRSDLQKILAEEVGYDNLNLGKKLDTIQAHETGFTLHFEDATSLETPLLIGADGIKSVVRKKLFHKNTLRDAQQVCWRGISEISLPEQYQQTGIEAWGKGKRFGFVPLKNNKVYWFALQNTPLVTHENLNEIFNEFHPDFHSILDATPKEQIIRSDIMDLKPIPKWYAKNVCLIGDAAHATTPNLGQGACQAIEDAYCLGKLLENGLSDEQLFEEYQKSRRKKVDYIVNTSWRLGKIAQLESPIGSWLRNNLMRLTPNSLNTKQLETIFSIDE